MTRSDAELALALWNDRASSLSPDLFDEKVWRDDGVTDELRLVAESAKGDVVGFVVGATRSTVPDGGTIKLLAVAPQARLQGVGTMLLERIEQQLRHLGLTTIRLGESPPNYWQPGVESDNEVGLSFFARRGFVQFGTVYNMTCRLDEASLDTAADEARIRSGGIVVRRAAPEDRGAVDNLLDALWPAWKPEVDVAYLANPKSVHVAAMNESGRPRIAGFAAHSTNNTSVGWFGPMGTDPDFRGTGIGTVLLKRCLQDLRGAGFTDATIPWVGPVDFYTRSVGADVSRTYHRFEKKID